MEITNLDKELELRKLLDELDIENNENFRQIASLMKMPEDQFATVAAVVLENYEKILSTPETQFNFSQAMNSMQLSLEEVENFFNATILLLEQSEVHQLSAQKISFLKSMVSLLHNAFAESLGAAKRVVKIPIEKCDERAKAPTYAHISDSGMDVYALEDISIAPGETKLIPLGIKVAIPLGYELQVRPKSGRSLRSKLRIANTPGTIDAGYRDEVAIIVENIEPKIKDVDYDYESDGSLIVRSFEFGATHTIGAGEKFAQLVLAEVPKVSWCQVDSVMAIGEDRGGGFGSSSIYSKEDPRYGSDLV